MKKIGIGLCTYNRGKDAKRVLNQIMQTIDVNKCDIIVADDGSTDDTGKIFSNLEYAEYATGENVGGARNKNRILKRFKDHDYIFIMEDDIYPIKPGWIEMIIECITLSNIQHFNYIHKSVFNLPGYSYVDDPYKYKGFTLRTSPNLGAQMMIMTKQCVKMVGGFAPDFKGYGWGHCHYTWRCAKAGMTTPYFKFSYIADLDNYFKDISLPAALNPDDRRDQARDNKVTFERLTKTGKLYYPIEGA